MEKHNYEDTLRSNLVLQVLLLGVGLNLPCLRVYVGVVFYGLQGSGFVVMFTKSLLKVYYSKGRGLIEA